MVFRLLHLPLPWTLGAMTAAAILALRAPGLVLPGVFRDGARPVIGVVAGSAFTPTVVSEIGSWWPIFLLLVLFFLTVSAAGGAFFRSFGFDRATAFFSACPGGLGEMAFLGQQFGADVRKLVLVHSVRIVMVVTVLPFALRAMTGMKSNGALLPHGPSASVFDWAVLAACAVAGYLVGRRLRAFGGLMLVPMLFSAVLHGTGVTAASVPYAVVAAMQVIIGCITGARFAGVRFAEMWRTLLVGLGWSLVLIAASALLAFTVSRLVAILPAALFLAFAPGGFSEMTVIAYATGIEVAFVVTCHAFRTLYIMLVSPILCRRLLKH